MLVIKSDCVFKLPIVPASKGRNLTIWTGLPDVGRERDARPNVGATRLHQAGVARNGFGAEGTSAPFGFRQEGAR
jgi:hypothetical protein